MAIGPTRAGKTSFMNFLYQRMVQDEGKVGGESTTKNVYMDDEDAVITY